MWRMLLMGRLPRRARCPIAANSVTPLSQTAPVARSKTFILCRLSGKVPALRIGGFSIIHRTRWGGVWLSDLPSSLAAIRRAAQLPAKAIGLGHLSPGLVARHYPGVPPMQVDCQLLTRAFSG
jgi:hypothetical protein